MRLCVTMNTKSYGLVAKATNFVYKSMGEREERERRVDDTSISDTMYMRCMIHVWDIPGYQNTI